MKNEILGVHIDNLALPEVLKRVEGFLNGNTARTIFTPNPEMLVGAQKDEAFRKILNASDMNLCDGFGIRLLSGFKIARIPGADFLLELCKLAEKRGDSIYLLGTGRDDILQKAKKNLLQKFPKLSIVGTHKGEKIDETNGFHILDQAEHEKIIDDIIACAPKILFVAYGHSKQEKWIHSFVAELPSVRLSMGVGGTFDFLSGEVKRAPKFLRSMGLEWLYRLCKEPNKRIKRIFNAVFIFPLFVFLRRK